MFSFRRSPFAWKVLDTLPAKAFATVELGHASIGREAVSGTRYAETTFGPTDDGTMLTSPRVGRSRLHQVVRWNGRRLERRYALHASSTEGDVVPCPDGSGLVRLHEIVDGGFARVVLERVSFEGTSTVVEVDRRPCATEESAWLPPGKAVALQLSSTGAIAFVAQVSKDGALIHACRIDDGSALSVVKVSESEGDLFTLDRAAGTDRLLWAIRPSCQQMDYRMLRFEQAFEFEASAHALHADEGVWLVSVDAPNDRVVTIEGKPEYFVVARRLSDGAHIDERKLPWKYPPISAIGTYKGARAFSSNEGSFLTIDTATLESRGYEYSRDGAGAAIGAFGDVIVCARFVGLASPSEIVAIRP